MNPECIDCCNKAEKEKYREIVDIQHEVIEHLEDQITWIASVIYYQCHIKEQDEGLEEMIKLGQYTTDTDDANADGEWTYNTTSKKITHQRGDNSRVGWAYDKGTQTGDNADVGTIGSRADL